MSNFPNVRLIHNGTNVAEDISNQPHFDLKERTDWLKEQIDSLLVQSSRVFVTEAPCSDSCIDSKLVYFNKDIQKWDLAVSALENPGQANELPEPSSYLQGIVKNVTGGAGSKKGDIYFYGIVNDINVVNLMEENEALIGDNIYLNTSQTLAGQGTYTPPVLEVFVGKFITSTSILISPDFRNLGESHRHIWFDLEYDKFTQLAPPSSGHWLYPYSEFPIWPPISYTSAAMSVNGVMYYQGASHDNYFYLAADGLHYIDPTYPPDPDLDVFDAILYYQVPYGQEKEDELITGGVDSIFARTLNLKIFKQGTTDPAAVGDLEILSIPILSTETLTADGSIVVKSLNVDAVTGDIQVFRGSVVEKLVNGTPNVLISEELTTTPATQGKLAVHVFSDYTYSTDAEPGWLVWKDIVVDPVTGQNQVKRGPVLEKLFPRYTGGTQNIYLTAHAPATSTETEQLDIAIEQNILNTTTSQTGSLPVKNITVTAEGNLDLVTGPVVESIQPATGSRIAVYDTGTTTPATQGELDIDVADFYRVKFIHQGAISTGATTVLYESSGNFLSELLVGAGYITRCFARLGPTTNHIVTVGTLQVTPYLDAVALTDLQKTFDNGAQNRIVDSGEFVPGGTPALAYTDKQELILKVVSSAGLAIQQPGGVNDIPSLEVVLFVTLT
jgi:hypothetical protein